MGHFPEPTRPEHQRAQRMSKAREARDRTHAQRHWREHGEDPPFDRSQSLIDCRVDGPSPSRIQPAQVGQVSRGLEGPSGRLHARAAWCGSRAAHAPRAVQRRTLTVVGPGRGAEAPLPGAMKRRTFRWRDKARCRWSRHGVGDATGARSGPLAKIAGTTPAHLAIC